MTLLRLPVILPSTMIKVQTFYSFTDLPENQLEDFKSAMSSWAEDLKIRGLVILGVEGINTTMSGAEENLKAFTGRLQELLHLPNLVIKYSSSEKQIFKRFNVKIRDEIVTLKKPEFVPDHPQNNHLSPEKWQEAMKAENTVVLDTRNTYETDIGKFKDAHDLRIDEFQEFPERIKTLDKDKTYLIYCTGGIRCEKAIMEMNAQGFENVYQLDGGILNYLEQFPNEDFEGECFVFDSRVAVDQNLQPSQTHSLCPHCGETTHQEIECLKCGSLAKVCPTCLAKEQEELQTCSKNCAHHYKLNPQKKSPQQKRFYHQKAQ